ncbi:pyridoxamine 5'-phosphate oxidase [Marinoscillum furvescens]|uniref:Pyridoxine/pyridoxamine 5'-phosphate oxidase n=1 Tax=Marinoscillum furvescens DSM 4134 TaxID=1122208 RepID=A0A3D9L8N6_MARFU|nr:pyridoxamine 5'-phosphate oxidase [Marinoscillum furvescens]REE02036.1 pyridoxamine 5'-phosphate oxidase [Marinoscillum furvescens DSM 4134]
MSLDIASLRNEYSKASLDLDSTSSSPIEQFLKWFEEAQKSEITEPNAMVLSTADLKGYTTQRTVLLKAFDEKGFVFYTNYSSKKAQQISENNQVSLLFPWYQLERQVIITGRAEKVSTAESLKYFTSRPSGSQLGAWVSHQSKIITSRGILEQKLNEIKEKFKDGKIPLPDFWGGYRVIPNSIEFWQGRPSRLHDRIYYSSDSDNNWSKQRLSP